MRFDLSEECLLTVQARDFDTGEKTLAQMITRDTPESLRESMEAAIKDGEKARPKWFQSFAQKVLKK